MFTVQGRYGYNGNGSDLAGGINTERLNWKPNTEPPLKQIREDILNLLKTGKKQEAFKMLTQSPATLQQKKIFFKKYF